MSEFLDERESTVFNVRNFGASEMKKIDDTLRKAAQAPMTPEDLRPLWTAANRSLVLSTAGGLSVFSLARKLMPVKTANAPLIAAGIAWVLGYRAANFLQREQVLDKLVNGDSKLSREIRAALSNVSVDEETVFERSDKQVSDLHELPRVVFPSPIRQNDGERKFLTWDDIRRRNEVKHLPKSDEHLSE